MAKEEALLIRQLEGKGFKFVDSFAAAFNFKKDHARKEGGQGKVVTEREKDIVEENEDQSIP